MSAVGNDGDGVPALRQQLRDAVDPPGTQFALMEGIRDSSGAECP